MEDISLSLPISDEFQDWIEMKSPSMFGRPRSHGTPILCRLGTLFSENEVIHGKNRTCWDWIWGIWGSVELRLYNVLSRRAVTMSDLTERGTQAQLERGGGK
jgi:hypothetical protein